MVSGPLVGDEASNKFYSRNAPNDSQNANHVLRHGLMPHRGGGDAAAAAASVDSSAEPGGNAPRGYSRVGDKVRISFNSKSDMRGIKWKLMGELEQVRLLVKNIEAKEARIASGYVSDDYVVDDRNAIAFRGLSVITNHNNDNSNVGGDNNVGGEFKEKKKKKTPKGGARNAKLHHSGSDRSLVSSVGKGDNGLVFGSGKNSGRLLNSCKGLLDKLMRHKHGWIFNKPVDAKALGLHDYYEIVKRPMDLGTVKSRLDKNWYKTAAEFAEDVRLTFNNAMLYNPKGQDAHVMAALLLKLFDDKWTEIVAKYTRNETTEMSNNSELPTPVSRNVQAPAPHVPRAPAPHVPRALAPHVPRAPAPHVSRAPAPHVSRAPAPHVSRAPAPAFAPPPPHPPLEMRTLDRAESMTKPTDPKPKPAFGHPGRKPVLKKPKARDPDKRDMNLEEKQRLSTDLQALPSEKLDNIVQIIKKRNPGLFQQEDEIELDIDSCDPETLWELDRFVTNYKKSLTKNKRKAEAVTQSVAETDYDIQEMNLAQDIAEAPIDVETAVEHNSNAHSPFQREDREESVSGSSSSSSGSGSSSSDSDGDSSSASGSFSNRSPRT